MFETTVDGSIRYDTLYHGKKLRYWIEKFYQIECMVNGWEPMNFDDTCYGYNMYAKILTVFFENGDKIDTKKLHIAWSENYLFWITSRPWEYNDNIKEYKGETDEKTFFAYGDIIPENKKKNIIIALKKLKSLY